MMTRETMRVGAVRTSVKLEPEFWDYLTEVARARESRLSALVNEVADATPGRANLASTLRVFALQHARRAARAPAPERTEDARLSVETTTP
jgi:predicted DNA-binding ribbon-helix-helix protein